MARKNDAVIYIITSIKSHAVICAIMTRQKRVTKAIIKKCAKIRRIFVESELCVYNLNSFSFVYVRFRSIVGAAYLVNGREKK